MSLVSTNCQTVLGKEPFDKDDHFQILMGLQPLGILPPENILQRPAIYQLFSVFAKFRQARESFVPTPSLALR
ncbi:hypothetical protein N7509_008629 [Penicillium cosmopolitanum]|uniref:Uncharacterized protein n=1 Tax=Penicillium cosmopolitanum TaxID=1131564 RepID=A0A9X0B2V9_9EURO|nr:uncharacterized protein N7509_008629 [Penicillium cosmopolitanum]KAJ5386088.1 hypothetical protein N7509_008629 [Penicillium cosmopolitanum]